MCFLRRRGRVQDVDVVTVNSDDVVGEEDRTTHQLTEEGKMRMIVIAVALMGYFVSSSRCTILSDTYRRHDVLMYRRRTQSSSWGGHSC